MNDDSLSKLLTRYFTLAAAVPLGFSRRFRANPLFAPMANTSEVIQTMQLASCGHGWIAVCKTFVAKNPVATTSHLKEAAKSLPFLK